MASTWPEVVIALVATLGSCFTSYLAYRAARDTRDQVKDSTVLTRSTDVDHIDRIDGAARRQGE